MIQVLIVEDERPIARAISRLVAQHPACTVAGTETNGEAALTFLRAHPVDLVITDIQMPVMTGLQLMQAMQEEFPDCLVVVLSGFSDFEYARTALQCHAFDYLLKSITRENLFRVLDRAADAHQQRRHTRQEQLLELALTGEPVRVCGRFQVLLSPHGPVSPETFFGSDCYVFRRERGLILLLEQDRWDPALARAYFEQMVQASDHPVSILCSTDPVEASALRKTVQELRQLLDRNAPLFRSVLLDSEELRRSGGVKSCPLQALQPEQAAGAIQTREMSVLRENLTRLLQGAVCRADVQDYLDAVLSDTRIVSHFPAAQIRQIKAELPGILDTASTAASCTERLLSALGNLQKESDSRRALREVVDDIAHQLETTYHLHHSTEALARQYNFVPSYLNKIFKQYKGVRPAEYLFQIRMERARAILEADPDILIKDVAASVGYNDAHYFSNVFKRATGQWPTDVQQAARKR